MVICGCLTINTIELPEAIAELCPVTSIPEPIIKIETRTETVNKNCFNAMAVGFSAKRACGGMDCGK